MAYLYDDSKDSWLAVETPIDLPGWFHDDGLMPFVARCIGLRCHLEVQQCMIETIKAHLDEDENLARQAANLIKITTALFALDTLNRDLHTFVVDLIDLEPEVSSVEDVSMALQLLEETQAWAAEYRRALAD